MLLREVREQLQQRRKELGDIFSEAEVKGDDGKKEYDFRQVKSVDVGNVEEKDKSIAIAEKVQQYQQEIDDLAKKEETLRGAVEAGERYKDNEGRRDRPPMPEDGEAKGGGRREYKSFKQMAREAVESDTFQKWLRGGMEGKVDVDGSFFEAKAVMTSAGGFPPESTRTGELVITPIRPLQITDIMPRGQTGQNEVRWMGQDTRTQAAAETDEGVAGPEAEFAFSERSTPVREIVVTLPVTDIQLEDAPLIESEIETMLNEDVQERLDAQIVNGNGTSPNLRGILNTTGILSRAVSTDTIPGAIFKAGTDIRTGIARAIATHVVMHPEDWQKIRLQRTSDGVYIFGDPQDPGQERIWGWPVVQNESLVAGNAIVGAFAARNIRLIERRGVSLTRGFVNDDFAKRQQTLLASMRAALQVKRAAAFNQVTGI